MIFDKIETLLETTYTQNTLFKHRKNCKTALFKVRIVENVFCRKDGKKEKKKGNERKEIRK